MGDLEEYDYKFKIVLLGDNNVGKSNIMWRYTRNYFKPNSPMTRGFNFNSKTIKHEEKIIIAEIWDVVIDERLKLTNFFSLIYRGAKGVLLVYDITSHTSFNNVKMQLYKAQSYFKPDLPIILVGNKCDLISFREVTQKEAIIYATKQSIPFFETSALDSTNIDLVFRELLMENLRRINAGFDSIDGERVTLKAVKKEKKSSCKRH